jgi:hypothetical protein
MSLSPTSLTATQGGGSNLPDFVNVTKLRDIESEMLAWKSKYTDIAGSTDFHSAALFGYMLSNGQGFTDNDNAHELKKMAFRLAAQQQPDNNMLENWHAVQASDVLGMGAVRAALLLSQQTLEQQRLFRSLDDVGKKINSQRLLREGSEIDNPQVKIAANILGQPVRYIPQKQRKKQVRKKPSLLAKAMSTDPDTTDKQELAVNIRHARSRRQKERKRQKQQQEQLARLNQYQEEVFKNSRKQQTQQPEKGQSIAEQTAGKVKKGVMKTVLASVLGASGVGITFS